MSSASERTSKIPTEQDYRVRNLIRAVVRVLFRLLSRLEVVGLEQVPKEGGVLLAVNHSSWVDPMLVFALVDRDNVTALVADKYKRIPLINWLVIGVKGIWLKRGEADLQALRVARDFLQQGGALGIAPEGTRSKTGELQPAKTGVAYLADKAGVPVVPIAITGAETAFRKLFRLHRPRIRIEFGEPFRLPPLDRRDRAASLQRNTDEIMARIAALLPPSYRGFYADHPRMQEILTARSQSQ